MNKYRHLQWHYLGVSAMKLAIWFPPQGMNPALLSCFMYMYPPQARSNPSLPLVRYCFFWYWIPYCHSVCICHCHLQFAGRGQETERDKKRALFWVSCYRSRICPFLSALYLSNLWALLCLGLMDMLYFAGIGNWYHSFRAAIKLVFLWVDCYSIQPQHPLVVYQA